jgi:hypothetical protein
MNRLIATMGSLTLPVAAAANVLSGDDREVDLDHGQPRQEVGVKYEVILGYRAGQARTAAGVLVGDVVVDDQVYLRRGLSIPDSHPSTFQIHTVVCATATTSRALSMRKPGRSRVRATRSACN